MMEVDTNQSYKGTKKKKNTTSTDSAWNAKESTSSQETRVK